MRHAARLVDLALAALIAVGLTAATLLWLLPITGRAAVIIAGGSMEPALPIGSLAIIEAPSAGRSLTVGDVVTIRLDEDRAIVTHRIVRLAERGGATWMELRGDANAMSDPVLVPASAVVGRATIMWPALGRWLTALGGPGGFQLIAGLAGSLLALSMLLRRMTEPRAIRPAPAPVPG